jgi:N-methylhydantoinase A
MRVSVDIGGTFTDCVVEHEHGVEFYKSPTTPADPVQGMLDAIAKAAATNDETLEGYLRRIERIVHGTTLGTNLLLTGRGAKVGFLTTSGFREVLEMRRGIRNLDHAMFDQVRAPYQPLVPRALRFGIAERTLYTGEIDEPVDAAAVEDAVRAMLTEGCEAVAIGFLHAYANPRNEQLAKAIVQRCAPETHVVCSHEVLPTLGEFERFSTTVVSAHIGPAVSTYLRRLDERLRSNGFDGTLLIMLSSGLMQTVEQCSSRAVELLVSGPAAAPSAALAVAEALGHRDILEIDMGGTSFDVCVIRNGAVPTTKDAFVGEERVACKMVDVHSLGAGGGSIAWVDSLGLIRVGPQSAGADPGPAAYGRSQLPTVTDADLVLGYLPADFFLGGEITLDVARAREAIRNLGVSVDLGVEETADAIFQTVTIAMADAVTEVCTKRGHDVRGFVIVAGGGAGGIHAAAIAEHLRVPTVILPPVAPVLSANGMLTMDIGQELARVGVWDRAAVTEENLNETFAEMIAAQSATFAGMGIDLSSVRFMRSVSMRYQGQFHEVMVDLPGGDLRQGEMEGLRDAFHDRHEDLYGYSLRWRVVEILECHLRGSTKQASSYEVTPEQAALTPLGDACVGERTCFVGRSHRALPVYQRDLLRPGHEFSGPALIDSRTSTTLVPETFDAQVDTRQNVILSLRAARGESAMAGAGEALGR